MLELVPHMRGHVWLSAFSLRYIKFFLIFVFSSSAANSLVRFGRVPQ